MRAPMLIVTVAVGLLFWPMGANAQTPSNGNGLLKWCSEYDPNAPASRSTAEETEANRRFADSAYCMGYVNGVADSLDSHQLISRPEGVTTGQTVAVVIKYMQDHPESLHLPSIVLVTNALTKAWPYRTS